MVNTVFPDDGGGNDGTAFQTTPEEGVLTLNGSAVITYGGDVTPGSTNTLTFVIADANDASRLRRDGLRRISSRRPGSNRGVSRLAVTRKSYPLRDRWRHSIAANNHFEAAAPSTCPRHDAGFFPAISTGGLTAGP
jgi:hypothetical protein